MVGCIDTRGSVPCGGLLLAVRHPIRPLLAVLAMPFLLAGAVAVYVIGPRIFYVVLAVWALLAVMGVPLDDLASRLRRKDRSG